MTISYSKHGQHIKHGLIQPYTFNQGWNDVTDGRFNAKFQYLATRFCVVNNDYWTKNDSGRWESVGNKTFAFARAFQELGGIYNNLSIMSDDIKGFMANGIVSFANLIYAPKMGDFLEFNGERRLNVYLDQRIDGDTDHIEFCEEFLKLIRNSLCNQPDELDLPAMLDEIMSKKPTAFRWVIHWLAARYQMPGYTTQTNLWFCGPRGTGKGSLMSVMRNVLGSEAVGKVDQSDIAKGWTTSLFGCDLLEWDEFKGTGWHDFSRFVKDKTGNESYNCTKRNVGHLLQPSVAFHIFSTNENHPIFIERDDRQNSFIATVEAESPWINRARKIWDRQNNLREPRIITGFAALLNEIDIDLDFIRTPFITALRGDLVEFFADDTIAVWWKEALDEGLPNKFPKFRELHEMYREFCQKHFNVKPKDFRSFKKEFEKLGFGKEIVGKLNGNPKAVRYVKLVEIADEEEPKIIPLSGIDAGAESAKRARRLVEISRKNV